MFAIEVDGEERLAVVVEIDAARRSDDPEPILSGIRHAVAAEHEVPLPSG